jgi:hypothetical protein
MVSSWFVVAGWLVIDLEVPHFRKVWRGGFITLPHPHPFLNCVSPKILRSSQGKSELGYFTKKAQASKKETVAC